MSFLESLRRLINYCENTYKCRPETIYAPVSYEPGAISEMSKSGVQFEIDTKSDSYLIFGVRLAFRTNVPNDRHPVMVFKGGKK